MHGVEVAGVVLEGEDSDAFGDELAVGVDGSVLFQHSHFLE